MRYYGNAYWNERMQATGQLRQERVALEAGRLLIVVNAQGINPETGEPESEFCDRLDDGAYVYKEHVNDGGEATIYVPGSLHGSDPQPLAEAGNGYLANEHNVPRSDLRGENWNRRYRGVVRNGADEALVASRAFKTIITDDFITPLFNRLIVIASPGQVDRTALYYLANGVPAEIRVPESLKGRNDLHHQGSAVRGLEWYTKRLNPDWQRGVLPWLIRWRRRPRPAGTLAVSNAAA